MSITGELREWFDRYTMRKDVYDELLAIADRIDAAHQKAMSRAGELLDGAEKERDYNYANWQDCKQKVLQHNITMGELSAEIERLKGELAHRIELPKDADGEVIHVGDELRDGWHEQNQGEVEWLMLNNHGWWLMLKNNCERFYAHDFHEWHHRNHKPPTVEDLLCELLDKVDDDRAGQAEIIVEYAKRLRLAGDAE